MNDLFTVTEALKRALLEVLDDEGRDMDWHASINEQIPSYSDFIKVLSLVQEELATDIDLDDLIDVVETLGDVAHYFAKYESV
jgi:hypothetical protein